MRFRLIPVAALSAVALSTAPAQSTDFWSGGVDCDALLPSYWQGPGLQLCPINGKEWRISAQP